MTDAGIRTIVGHGKSNPRPSKYNLATGLSAVKHEQNIIMGMDLGI